MNRLSHGSVHGLTKENFLGVFPLALDEDSKVLVKAGVTAEELAKRLGEIDLARIYAAIDRLPEPLLDILAYDFKIDWWDPEYNLEEKRRILKHSWYVHKHLGTKAAVETALRAIYPKAKVQEWFEYGGEPYYFRLNIDLTGEISDAARPWRVMERVDFYKSLRSHLDVIEYTMEAKQPAVLRLGARAGIRSTAGLQEERDVFDAQSTLRLGAGWAGGQTGIPVQEDTGLPGSVSILRTGGVCTVIANLPPTEGE